MNWKPLLSWIIGIHTILQSGMNSCFFFFEKQIK